MLKSIIIASLLLASQVFADILPGHECSTDTFNYVQEICDANQNILNCTPNTPPKINAGTWKSIQTCKYCCDLLNGEVFCTESKAACDREIEILRIDED